MAKIVTAAVFNRLNRASHRCVTSHRGEPARSGRSDTSRVQLPVGGRRRSACIWLICDAISITARCPDCRANRSATLEFGPSARFWCAPSPAAFGHDCHQVLNAEPEAQGATPRIRRHSRDQSANTQTARPNARTRPSHRLNSRDGHQDRASGKLHQRRPMPGI